MLPANIPSQRRAEKIKVPVRLARIVRTFLVSEKVSDNKSFLIIYTSVFIPKKAKLSVLYVRAAIALPIYEKKESSPEHIRSDSPRGYTPKPKFARPNIKPQSVKAIHLAASFTKEMFFSQNRSFINFECEMATTISENCDFSFLFVFFVPAFIISIYGRSFFSVLFIVF